MDSDPNDGAPIDPKSLKVPELRSALHAHKVRFPSNAKKAELMRLYTENIGAGASQHPVEVSDSDEPSEPESKKRKRPATKMKPVKKPRESSESPVPSSTRESSPPSLLEIVNKRSPLKSPSKSIFEDSSDDDELSQLVEKVTKPRKSKKKDDEKPKSRKASEKLRKASGKEAKEAKEEAKKEAAKEEATEETKKAKEEKPKKKSSKVDKPKSEKDKKKLKKEIEALKTEASKEALKNEPETQLQPQPERSAEEEKHDFDRQWLSMQNPVDLELSRELGIRVEGVPGQSPSFDDDTVIHTPIEHTPSRRRASPLRLNHHVVEPSAPEVSFAEDTPSKGSWPGSPRVKLTPKPRLVPVASEVSSDDESDSTIHPMEVSRVGSTPKSARSRATPRSTRSAASAKASPAADTPSKPAKAPRASSRAVSARATPAKVKDTPLKEVKSVRTTPRTASGASARSTPAKSTPKKTDSAQSTPKKTETAPEDSDSDSSALDSDSDDENSRSSWLRTVVPVVFTLAAWLFLAGAGLFGAWYYQQLYIVGYCGHEINTTTFSSRPEPVVRALGVWLDSHARPECIPCPQHARCFANLELGCYEDFIEHRPWNNFLFPGNRRCVPDSKKAEKLELMIENAKDLLREKNARRQCGRAPDDVAGISARDLHDFLLEMKAPYITEAEFEELWRRSVDELAKEPEIIVRHTAVPSAKLGVVDAHHEDAHVDPADALLRSTSLRNLSVGCQFRNSVLGSVARFKWNLAVVAAVVVVVKLAQVAFHRYQLRQLKIDIIYKDVLKRLHSQARRAAADPGQSAAMGSIQLRDAILANEHNLKKRVSLWKQVVARVEQNTNIVAKIVEEHGEILKVWQWVSAVEHDDASEASEANVSVDLK
ncbi:inner nuclear membrane protein Src1p [Diutina catenulata]